MFRSPKPGDWAAEDENTSPLATPAPVSPTAMRVSSLTTTSSQDAPSTSSERFHRARNNSGGRFERDREYQSGRFDRESDSGGRFDRDRDYRRLDRKNREYDDERHFDRDRQADRGERRFERDARRPMSNNWGYNAERRGTRDLPLDQGFVVSIKENFGFVRCLERENDLFFHISEAPVDIQLQDEVEFRVKYNQRSDKEMACQLGVLPKGTIQIEEVSDDVVDGIVTKSLPRGGHGSTGRGSFQDERYGYREEFGLIEVKKVEKKEEKEEQQEEKDEEANKPLLRREVVRFTSDSMANPDREQRKDEKEDSNRNQTKMLPQFGDEVQFRVAKHRKTGVKRAVDVSITVSAREKLEKEIEAKLATMTREHGVVDRVKTGGGFIKCCNRPLDIYFPFHEVRASNDQAVVETEDTTQRSRGGKGSFLIREGDEVSFYVYEDQDDEFARSRSRLTALRVQKLPPGTVSFEELLREDVEGMVSKLPKEPRHGPEVIGCIAVQSIESNDVENKSDIVENVASERDETSLTKQKSKAKNHKVAFRLCDTEDPNYVPCIDDKVVFDEVLDKRTGNVKAVKVRVLQLNPKNRETGTINAIKDEFGFIKCADRAGDAYFRFSDVLDRSQNFGNGTDVAFDVAVDSKSDHIRASRIQILPRGTVKWEDVVAEGLEGRIVAIPSARRGLHASRGGRGDKGKQFSKFLYGKISFVTPKKQHLIDFLPELKEKVDATFLTSEEDEESSKDDETSKEKGDEDDKKPQVRLVFPSSVSKFERAALHEYSEWLGLHHTSRGEGLHRQLEIVTTSKISVNTVKAKRETNVPELTVEFKDDDMDEVRYNPHVGDRVKFDLVLMKRTKQFQCKSISCLEAASALSKPKLKTETTESGVKKGEGYIVMMKPQGFGFIQPALQSTLDSLDENLYFHIKEITTGESIHELKEGTEVQYTIVTDDTKKKKKNRAVAIQVVPSGTIQKVEPKSVRGVVSKASLLQRMKSGTKSRLAKANNIKASTLGSIRLCENSSMEEREETGSDVDGESEDEAAREESHVAARSHDRTVDELKTTETKQKHVGKEETKRGKPTYVYNLRDLVDPSIVVREGDEVEFVPQLHFRASQIRLVTSHAKQGLVTRVTEDYGGMIRLDGGDEDDDSPLEASFTAKRVLRGDLLSVGDRVEFAYKPPAPFLVPDGRPKDDIEEKKSHDEKESAIPATASFGQALSILRLSSSTTSKTTSHRREARMVNSTLKKAMRQVGANAMVASRMARGPDGTRGFVNGWKFKTAKTAETTSENVSVKSTSTSITTTSATCLTDEKKT